MPYTMSFAQDFYTGGLETYSAPAPTDTPRSVIEALYSLNDQEWSELCDDLGVNAKMSDPWEVLAQLMDSESMSCDGYESPIEVYLTDNVSVTVYE